MPVGVLDGAVLSVECCSWGDLVPSINQVEKKGNPKPLIDIYPLSFPQLSMAESASLFVPRTLGSRRVRVSLICVYVCALCTGMGAVRLDDGGGGGSDGTHSFRSHSAATNRTFSMPSTVQAASQNINTHGPRPILMMQRDTGWERGGWRRVRSEFLTRRPDGLAGMGMGLGGRGMEMLGGCLRGP